MATTQPQSMAETIRTPAMGLAIRLCVQLQQQARRHNAMPELSAEEDLAIRLLFQELGQCLADGDNAIVSPRLPFHLGGTFTADNLEIVLDPEPVELVSRRNAHRPAFHPGAPVSFSIDGDGEALTHRVVAMDWDSATGEWLYQISDGYDRDGNLVALGCYASEHRVLQP
jgi:hypothetical protein